MAEANRKLVATQFRARAFMENSRPTAGRATLAADPMNGVRKEAMVVTIRATVRLVAGYGESEDKEIKTLPAGSRNVQAAHRIRK